MIRISLIVPTFNRANQLVESLPTFLEQTLSPSEYEILIIDNNSTDDTKETVKRIMKHAECRWRYRLEPEQGLHAARNRGIREAAGDIVVFGDDDIAADPEWLSRLLAEFDRDPATGAAGGKILPLWSSPPEPWVYDYGSPRTHALFAYLDLGEERLVLEKDYVFGCNLAFRRRLAIETGGSHPDTYPRKLKHLSGTGECAMIDNIRKLDYNAVYVPDAVVYHHVDASRITLNYFIDRYERWAVEEAFDAFRNLGIKEAVRRLLLTAIERLDGLEEASFGKTDPEAYKIIHRHWAYQMIEQTFRVLHEPALYAHITKRNYIK